MLCDFDFHFFAVGSLMKNGKKWIKDRNTNNKSVLRIQVVQIVHCIITFSTTSSTCYLKKPRLHMYQRYHYHCNFRWIPCRQKLLVSWNLTWNSFTLLCDPPCNRWWSFLFFMWTYFRNTTFEISSMPWDMFSMPQDIFHAIRCFPCHKLFYILYYKMFCMPQMFRMPQDVLHATRCSVCHRCSPCHKMFTMPQVVLNQSINQSKSFIAENIGNIIQHEKQ